MRGKVRRGFFEAFQATGRSVRHIKAGYLNYITVHITHNCCVSCNIMSQCCGFNRPTFLGKFHLKMAKYC